jgi:hypothetical protein
MGKTTLEEPTGMVVEMGMTVEPKVVLEVMVVSGVTEDKAVEFTGRCMDDAAVKLEASTVGDD